MNRSHAALLLTVRALGKQKLYLWTFTFKELLSIKETRKRWNYLLTLMLRTWPQLQGVRVFELHKEHGLHVHLLTNRFIEVDKARALAMKAGWGRIHVKRLEPEHAPYIAKYLSKSRPECFKGWRLWAAFGKEWGPVKANSVEKQTLLTKIYRACKEWLEWQGRDGLQERLAFARRMMFLTIENGWKPGLGPQEKPYWMCCPEELEWHAEYCDAPF